MQLPSDAVVNSVLRHIGTGGGAVVGTLATLGFLTPENAQAVITDMHQIMDGLTQAWGGFSKIAVIAGPAFAAVMAALAARSSTLKSLIASVAQADKDKKIDIQGAIVAPPDVANAVPSDKVVPSK